MSHLFFELEQLLARGSVPETYFAFYTGEMVYTFPIPKKLSDPKFKVHYRSHLREDITLYGKGRQTFGFAVAKQSS